MRILFSDLKGRRLSAKDGKLGNVKDILMDDRFWGTSYIVADTSKWLPGRTVLLGVEAVRPPTDLNYILGVKHTVEEVKNAPPLEADAPVSKQHEIMLHAYYNWTIPQFLFSQAPLTTVGGVPLGRQAALELMNRMDTNSHLRSANEIIGYDVNAQSVKIGVLDNIVLQLKNWSVSLLVVKINKEYKGRANGDTLPVSPAWIQNVFWKDRSIRVDLPSNVFFDSPEFQKDLLNEHYLDKQLFEHYRDYLHTPHPR